MIHPKELRLGNYVKDRGGKIIRIDFFENLQQNFGCKFGMNYLGVDGLGPFHPLTEYTDYANPIPLTYDILLKIGFNQMPNPNNTNSQIFFNSFLRLLYHNETKVFSIRNFSGAISIDYLHQLQNLYYSLYGTDLEVTI